MNAPAQRSSPSTSGWVPTFVRRTMARADAALMGGAIRNIADNSDSNSEQQAPVSLALLPSPQQSPQQQPPELLQPPPQLQLLLPPLSQSAVCRRCG